MPQYAAIPDGKKLTYLQPVFRHLVHRAAVAEVFVTDAVPADENDSSGDRRFLVAAQWPRDHALYHPDAAGTSDPLLFAETIRQTMVYVAHRFQDIPLSHRFIGFDMDFEITDSERLRVGAAPQDVVLDTRWLWQASRPPKRYGFRVEADLLVDGHRCGHGGVRVVAVDDKRYDLLRGRRTPQFEAAVPAAVHPGRWVPAASVGRLRSKDSVLARGEGTGEWWLRLDLDHAILFDHPSDHAPLMALLEGFRQLGHLLVDEGVDEGVCVDVQEGDQETVRGGSEAGPPTLLSLQTDCLTFGELDVPIGLVVREDREENREDLESQEDRQGQEDRQDLAVPGARPVRRLSIDAVQGDKVVATSVSRWLMPAAAASMPKRVLARHPWPSLSPSSPSAAPIPSSSHSSSD